MPVRSTISSTASSAASTSRRAASTCAGRRRVGRRCRSVIRTLPTSTERAASTSVVPRHELGGAAAEVDDEVGRGHADRLQVAGRAARTEARPRRRRRRPRARRRGRRTPRAPRRRTPPRCGRRATPRSRRSAPARRRAPGTARRTRAVTARVRAIASGAMTPVRSMPCPSRTISIRRTTSMSRPSSPTSATSRRSELVPQSMAATRGRMPSLTARCRHPSLSWSAPGRRRRPGRRPSRGAAATTGRASRAPRRRAG